MVTQIFSLFPLGYIVYLVLILLQQITYLLCTVFLPVFLRLYVCTGLEDNDGVLGVQFSFAESWVFVTFAFFFNFSLVFGNRCICSLCKIDKIYIINSTDFNQRITIPAKGLSISLKCVKCAFHRSPLIAFSHQFPRY